MNKGTTMKELLSQTLTMNTLVDLVNMIEKPEGVHNITIKLFSISFPQLCFLQELALS